MAAQSFRLAGRAVVLATLLAVFHPIAADTIDVSVKVMHFACSDGIDNDSDGLVDHPDDPGCADGSDNNEADPATPSPPPSSSGGGGGGGIIYQSAHATFSGWGYPRRAVMLFKDAHVASVVTSAADGRFEVLLSSLSAGDYLFAVRSTDARGSGSGLVTLPVRITAAAENTVSQIILPPTLYISEAEVAQGEPVHVSGMATPEALVAIRISGDQTRTYTAHAAPDGSYTFRLDSGILTQGAYTASAQTRVGGAESSFGNMLRFIVGTETNARSPNVCNIPTDFNRDCAVDLIDFSIAAFWYRRPAPPVHLDINGDRIVDLTEFSIMAFYWTG